MFLIVENHLSESDHKVVFCSLPALDELLRDYKARLKAKEVVEIISRNDRGKYCGQYIQVIDLSKYSGTVPLGENNTHYGYFIPFVDDGIEVREFAFVPMCYYISYHLYKNDEFVGIYDTYIEASSYSAAKRYLNSLYEEDDDMDVYVNECSAIYPGTSDPSDVQEAKAKMIKSNM